MHVKKGDNVIVLTGKDKGKSGKVVRAIPSLDKVVVEGLNMVSKHERARKAGQKGQTIRISMPIHVSNVKLEGGKTKRAPAKKKVAAKKAVK